MPEAISFWLDNKKVSALKVLEVGNQILVDYRGKFYVIKNGSAVMKGSKPLHYSKSSMPLTWKKALLGDPTTLIQSDSDEELLPLSLISRKNKTKILKETLDMPEATTPTVQNEIPSPVQKESKSVKQAKKIEVKPIQQTSVSTQCPYCGQKQEISVEKGKNGKPFFVSCPKCSSDFAVRFVPVIMFQAQVAGFK